MDIHHVAHYGIAGALAGAIAFVSITGVKLPKGSYAPLTAAQGASLGKSLADAKIAALTVYCLNPKCDGIADSVVDGAESAGVGVTLERSIAAPDGVSVGASDPALARALAGLVYEGSQHALEPRISVDPSTVAFISFGKLAK